MPEPLRQITITVISPNLKDIEHASNKAVDLIVNLSPRAMITIDVTHEIPSSEEQLTPKEKWKKTVE